MESSNTTSEMKVEKLKVQIKQKDEIIKNIRKTAIGYLIVIFLLVFLSVVAICRVTKRETQIHDTYSLLNLQVTELINKTGTVSIEVTTSPENDPTNSVTNVISNIHSLHYELYPNIDGSQSITYTDDNHNIHRIERVSKVKIL